MSKVAKDTQTLDLLEPRESVAPYMSDILQKVKKLYCRMWLDTTGVDATDMLPPMIMNCKYGEGDETTTGLLCAYSIEYYL